MHHTSDTVIGTLREMAWQRAKGELRAYLEAYWPEWDKDGKQIDNGFAGAKAAINALILAIEGHDPE